jgi:hypothetical protein
VEKDGLDFPADVIGLLAIDVALALMVARYSAIDAMDQIKTKAS